MPNKNGSQFFLTNDNLNDFLHISQTYPPATREENVELVHAARNGNEEAKEMLIKKNIRLVLSALSKIKVPYHSIQKIDLIQEGCEEILTSLDDFDEKKGSFSTFMLPRIIAKMKRYIHKSDALIHVPQRISLARARYIDLVNSCKQNGTPLPGQDEICEMLNITPYVLTQVLDYEKNSVKSLSESIGNSDELTWGDTLSTPDEMSGSIIDTIYEHDLLASLKVLLGPALYYVIYYRVIFDRKIEQKALADELGVTKSLIGQKEEEAKYRLKKLYDPFTHTWKFDLGHMNHRDLENMTVAPIEPRNIVEFLYVRDQMDKDECTVLRTVLLEDRKDNVKELMHKLNLDAASTQNFIDRTLEKSNAIVTQNAEDFSEFRKAVLKKYKTKIFQIPDIDVNDFRKQKLELFKMN